MNWFWPPTNWRTYITACWRDWVASVHCGYKLKCICNRIIIQSTVNYSNMLSHTVTARSTQALNHVIMNYSQFYIILYSLKHRIFNPTLSLCVRVTSMLRSNRISCVSNSSFVGLSSVRLLSLYDNQITSMNPGAFDTLHSLSTLWVKYLYETHTHVPVSQYKGQRKQPLCPFAPSLCSPATFWPILSTVTVTWLGLAIGWGVNASSLVILAARAPTFWRRYLSRM